MLIKGDRIAVEYDVDGEVLYWDAIISERTGRSAFFLKFESYVDGEVRLHLQVSATFASFFSLFWGQASSIPIAALFNLQAKL